MGGGADGEDPGSPPPPEDAAGSFEAAGFDLEPETHPKDEPDNNPAQEEAHLSESIGTEDSASEEEEDADSAPPVHPVQGDGEHGGWDTDDESIEVVGDDESIDDQVWQNIIAAHGVDGFDDSDDFDEESGDEDDDSEDDESDMSGFDEDAMHFEIEGTTSQGSQRQVDPEERGHYLLHDGRVPASFTGMNHQQGSDSVCAAGPGRLLVTGDSDVRLLHADHIHIAADGSYDAEGRFTHTSYGPSQAQAEARGEGGFETCIAKQDLPFSVYSVAYDEPSRLMAVCGDVRSHARDVNLAVYRVVNYGGTAMGDSVFVPVAEVGVGAMGRFGRDMVNCVRFGKSVSPRVRTTTNPGLGGHEHRGGDSPAVSAPSAPSAPRDVLLCASQDGNCYVMSVDVKDDAGAGEDVHEAPYGSPGNQGGRGPRRRPRLDAQLVEEARIAFPVASNAAASSPDGRCVAICGDAEFVLVNGGPRGYGDHGHGEHLAINGDPSSAGHISGEAAGGMYTAWSPTGEYLAATSDSLHAVAVWRVTVHEPGVDKPAPFHHAPHHFIPLGQDRKREAGPLRIQRVAYFRDHAHPCLPVQFLPSDGNIVVWAERGGRVHAYDLRCARASAPGSSSAVNLSPAVPKEGGGAIAALAGLRRRRYADDDSQITVLGDDVEDGSEAEADGEDWWDVARSEGVEVCLNPVSVRLRKRVGLGVRDHFQEPDQDQRNFVQTIRSRVRGKYVTGLCVVASHPVPAPLPGSPGLIDGFAAGLAPRAPPHDLVFVGTPDGVLRFRCPVAWTPETHPDFPVAFRKASRTFMQCAAVDFARKAKGGSDEEGDAGGLSLGDLPQEVLLHIVGLAAVPLSDWAHLQAPIAEQKTPSIPVDVNSAR